MPTLQRKILKRQIVFPIRLLNQGQAVRDLHEALGSLEFAVGEREVKERRFGRTTRQAVIAFQGRQNLQPNGQIDEGTANRLNELLTRQGFLPAKNRPFRDRDTLRFKIRETGRLEDDARNFVRQQLNAELKEAIVREFDQPSEALQAAVRAMDLDYEAAIAEPLNVVLTDRVAPARPPFNRVDH
jgi:peptidoglycan hydrolase-like protein with peptidoglycan-binding domain